MEKAALGHITKASIDILGGLLWQAKTHDTVVGAGLSRIQFFLINTLGN